MNGRRKGEEEGVSDNERLHDGDNGIGGVHIIITMPAVPKCSISLSLVNSIVAGNVSRSEKGIRLSCCERELRNGGTIL